MGKMKIYTENEMLDKHIGKIETPTRDALDNEFKVFVMGEAIKDARLKKQQTQQQLSERSGIGRFAL